MSYKKYKYLAVTAASIILMTGCQPASDLRQHPEITAFTYKTNGFVDDLNMSDKNGGYVASEEDRQLLSQMDLLLTNDKSALYLGAQYDIALFDKETGAVFFSNQNLYSNNVQELSEEDRSQMSIEFYDNTDTQTTMTSYPDCFDNMDKNQVTVEKQENQTNLTYVFGSKQDDKIICPAFSSTTYDRLIGLAQQNIDSGKMTIMQVGRFKMGYIHIVYKDLTPAEKSIYSGQYPKLEELGDMYVSKPNLTNLQKKEIEEVSIALGLDKQSIKSEIAGLGELKDNQSDSPYFEITLNYRLDGRDLIVSIDPKSIVEQKSYRLTKIEILGSLGAVQKSKDGYLFIPDGSGNIIRCNTKSTNMDRMKVQFYSSDFGVDQQNSNTLTSDSTFPVFGAYDGVKSLFSVVESGEALGGVTALLPNEYSDYAKIVPYFQYHVKDSIDLNGMDKAKSKNIYSSAAIEYPFVIRYHMLYGDNATYSGMARYYRNYLTGMGVLKPIETGTAMPIDISFIGAFSKREMKYGLQMNSSVAATPFNKAQEIVSYLKNGGVSAMNVLYLGAINGGLDYAVPQNVKFVKEIGGLAGFQSLQKELDAYNFPLLLAVDFTRAYEKGNGLNEQNQLSRYLSKNYAVIAQYHPADSERSVNRIAYQISPASLIGIANSFMKKYGDSKSKGLYLASIGAYLSGDYNEKDEITREESKLLTIETLKQISAAGFNLKLDGGNSYVLQYADSLTNIPVSNSNYTLLSESIPFVGMVLHGSIPCTGPILNQQGNMQKALLQTIESGAGLNYQLMSEDPIIFAGTEYTEFYSMSADQWKDNIIKEYKFANSIFADLATKTITEHKKIANQVYETVYSNGTGVLVNYSDSSVTVDGIEIAAMNYNFRKVR